MEDETVCIVCLVSYGGRLLSGRPVSEADAQHRNTQEGFTSSMFEWGTQPHLPRM